MDERGGIELRYHPINDRNELMTGICRSTPEVLPNGKIRLHGSWEWTSGGFRKVRPFLKNSEGACALRITSDPSEPAVAEVFIDLRDGLLVNGSKTRRR